MTDRVQKLANALQARFEAQLSHIEVALDEVTIEVDRQDLLQVCAALRDEASFGFEQLIDLCGVDYATYGSAEWDTNDVSGQGFSRGRQVNQSANSHSVQSRFAVVYHFLSVANNHRLRLRVYADDEFPVVDSVASIWNVADWFEREAFDLYGIMFEGHPDLRRLLTDYGFIGHPFRKDFPLIGNVEVRFDEKRQRVIYQPVSIEERVLVPKVVRGEKPENREAVDNA